MLDHYVVRDGGAQTQEELGQLSTRQLSRFLKLFEEFFLFCLFVCFLALVLDRITVYSSVVAKENILSCQRI